jgi:tRNA synthetases class I (E and Q), catalytic domain
MQSTKMNDDGTAQDSAPTVDESLPSQGSSKKGLKKAAKEAAKAGAKAKKKEDGAISKLTQDTNNVQIEQQVPRPRQGANYKIGLRNTDQGVVTRFPPEPSGYLHIGHAKAALLNDYFAHEEYNGTLLLRFDDTNPRKEKEEFQNAIIEDLALMGIRPDRVSHSSDYFEEFYQYCIDLIKSGNAYAEDTAKEEMEDLRKNRKKSARRDDSIESSLAHFAEMKSAATKDRDGVSEQRSNMTAQTALCETQLSIAALSRQRTKPDHIWSSITSLAQNGRSTQPTTSAAQF